MRSSDVIARALVFAVIVTGGVVAGGSCGFDRSDRWDDFNPNQPPPQPVVICSPDQIQCTSRLERCEATPNGAGMWVTVDDCASRGQVCAAKLMRCANCFPDERTCDGATVLACSSDGATNSEVEVCDLDVGVACRSGVCTDLCADARRVKSNVGCEYWAADLDNAMINATLNAAAQQYAIVVSNPQPDLPANVTVEQDDAITGPVDPTIVGSATIPPNNLRVFKLGPREVDGSPPGEFDTGKGTARTRHGFRVLSDVPVVVYQFNPLDNVNVFSNDASLLKPVEAVTYTPGALDAAYLVVGWPQTIAHTDNPDTNFNPRNPIDLRAFVAILGTRPDTRVRFTTTTRVIAGSGIPERQPGEVLEATLQPFEVLNLESGGFNADFTGSLIEADQPIIVFSGGEASDAPKFDRLANRFCCADHLEEQLDPIRTAGTSFIAAHAPNRTTALLQAGAPIGVVEEPEYFRVVSVSSAAPAVVTTTLPPPDDQFTLSTRGAYRDLTSTRSFLIESDEPVMLASVQASQEAAGVSRGLPGGDPSLIVVPPVQQFRPDYVFLTPDKYAFDFIVVAAPPDATVLIDGAPVQELNCKTEPADGLTPEERGSEIPPQVVHQCQLSFPVIDPEKTAPNNLLPGLQNDGVHRVVSDRNVLVLVYGFDSYVSYGYAAGTQLRELSTPR